MPGDRKSKKKSKGRLQTQNRQPALNGPVSEEGIVQDPTKPVKDEDPEKSTATGHVNGRAGADDQSTDNGHVNAEGTTTELHENTALAAAESAAVGADDQSTDNGHVNAEGTTTELHENTALAAAESAAVGADDQSTDNGHVNAEGTTTELHENTALAAAESAAVGADDQSTDNGHVNAEGTTTELHENTALAAAESAAVGADDQSTDNGHVNAEGTTTELHENTALAAAESAAVGADDQSTDNGHVNAEGTTTELHENTALAAAESAAVGADDQSTDNGHVNAEGTTTELHENTALAAAESAAQCPATMADPVDARATVLRPAAATESTEPQNSVQHSSTSSESADVQDTVQHPSVAGESVDAQDNVQPSSTTTESMDVHASVQHPSTESDFADAQDTVHDASGDAENTVQHPPPSAELVDAEDSAQHSPTACDSVAAQDPSTGAVAADVEDGVQHPSTATESVDAQDSAHHPSMAHESVQMEGTCTDVMEEQAATQSTTEDTAQGSVGNGGVHALRLPAPADAVNGGGAPHLMDSAAEEGTAQDSDPVTPQAKTCASSPPSPGWVEITSEVHRTYHTLVRCTVQQEYHITVWYDIDRRTFQAAQAEVFRQKHQCSQLKQRLQEQLMDVKNAVWRLEALYQTIECKVANRDALLPNGTVRSTFYDDVVSRIPSVLQVLCQPTKSRNSGFKPQLLEHFVQLVPGAEEPEEVRWEGYSLVACPKEKQPVLRYLVLSRHLLYVYESKEAYYGHGPREKSLDVRGCIIDGTLDFVVVLHGPSLEWPHESLRLQYESGEEWRAWREKLQKAAGRGQLQVWQNERWLPFVGWGRQTLTDVHGRLPRPFEAMDLLVEQSGYRWWGDWALAQGEKFGEQGWQYATDFGGEYAAQSRRRTTVRRRLWTRGCIPKWAPGFSPDT